MTTVITSGAIVRGVRSGSRDRTTNAVLFGAAVAASMVFSDIVLYQPLIVPRLRVWHSVPWIWWTLVAIPPAAAILFVGTRLKTLAGIVIASVAAASITTLYLAVAAFTGQPGHFKSIAVESPREFWSLVPPALTVVMALMLWAVRYVKANR